MESQAPIVMYWVALLLALHIWGSEQSARAKSLSCPAQVQTIRQKAIDYGFLVAAGLAIYGVGWVVLTWLLAVLRAE